MYGIHGPVHNFGISACCVSSSGEPKAFKFDICRGAVAVPAPAIDSGMILTAADLVAAALDTLTPAERQAIDIHIYDGRGVFTVARRIGLRKREAESLLEAAISKLHAYMLRRGIRGSADVL